MGSSVRRFVGSTVRRFVGSVVLVCACAAPAAAQPTPWQPERITAGWVFTPAIAFGTMWDSNVTLRNDPRNVNPEISELIGLVNPRGELAFNGRRAKFSAGYSGSLEAYRTLEELTHYEQRGRAEVLYQMTPRLAFDTRHDLHATPTTDALDLSGVPFTRVGSRMVNSGGGFTADLTRRMKLRTAYAFQWVEFDRDPEFARLQGGHQHSPSAELTYAVSRRLDVGGTWIYRHASIDGAEELIDTHQVAGVAQYELTEQTKLRGMAGVASLHVNGTGESAVGPSYGAGVSHQLRRTMIDASYERSFVPSFGFGGMTASQEARASVHVPFMQGRVSASGSVAYRRNTPVLSTSFGLQLSSWWATGSIGYGVARWLRMETFVNVRHQTVESATQTGYVDRTRVGVQFVTLKPVRIQ